MSGSIVYEYVKMSVGVVQVSRTRIIYIKYRAIINFYF